MMRLFWRGTLAILCLCCHRPRLLEQLLWCSNHPTVWFCEVSSLRYIKLKDHLPRSVNESALFPEPHHRVPGTIKPRFHREWPLTSDRPSWPWLFPAGSLSPVLLTDLFWVNHPAVSVLEESTESQSASETESSSNFSCSCRWSLKSWLRCRQADR